MNYIKRPEPGRIIERERIVETIIEKPAQQTTAIDLSALANAVAIAISGILPSNAERTYSTNNTMIPTDEFDNSKTLEKLAKSMIVQRGGNISNFENLGNENQTKTNNEDNAKTIDLLSNLDD